MKNDRLKKAGIALWVFIHSILLLLGFLSRGTKDFQKAIKQFYPLYYDRYEELWYVELSYVKRYDISEFVIYVITPVFLYYLFRYVKGDKIPFIK
jgi:hypothetical protein